MKENIPASQYQFTQKYRVPSYDVSLNRQVKFYTVFNFFLDISALHAKMLGFGYHDMLSAGQYWVLSRFHVEMKKYPVMDETIILQTWPKGTSRLFGMRDFKIFSENNEEMALATTAWLILDAKTGKPKNPENIEEYSGFNSQNAAIREIPGKLPAIPQPDRIENTKVKYADLDINKHVTSSRYIEWVQNCFPADQYEEMNIRSFQINYKAETRFSEEVEIRIKDRSSLEGSWFFEGIKASDKMPAFRARLEFGKF